MEIGKAGTGAWARGFGSSRILMIDQWTVSLSTARQPQLDRSVLCALLEQVWKNYRSFVAVVNLTQIIESTGSIQSQQLVNTGINREQIYRTGILRSVGFRRIGTGPCFGWSPWSDHESQQLAAIEDY